MTILIHPSHSISLPLCNISQADLGDKEERKMLKVNSSVNKGESSSKITALVVDDDTLNQMIHHRLLDNLGIQNQVVKNGKEAVDVHSSGKHFDLILMDRDMPVMNGIEATRKLRSMGIRSLIVGVSACSTEKEKQEFLEAGLDDFQEKPLTSTKLASILHKVEKNV